MNEQDNNIVKLMKRSDELFIDLLNKRNLSHNMIEDLRDLNQTKFDYMLAQQTELENARLFWYKVSGTLALIIAIITFIWLVNI